MFAGEGREEVAGWLEGYLYREEGIPDEEMDGDAEIKEEQTDEVVAEQDMDGTVKDDEEVSSYRSERSRFVAHGDFI